MCNYETPDAMNNIILLTSEEKKNITSCKYEEEVPEFDRSFRVISRRWLVSGCELCNVRYYDRFYVGSVPDDSSLMFRARKFNLNIEEFNECIFVIWEDKKFIFSAIMTSSNYYSMLARVKPKKYVMIECSVIDGKTWFTLWSSGCETVKKFLNFVDATPEFIFNLYKTFLGESSKRLEEVSTIGDLEPYDPEKGMYHNYRGVPDGEWHPALWKIYGRYQYSDDY